MTAADFRRLRVRSKLSREALAVLMGIHPVSVGRKERGKIPVTVAEAHFMRCVVAPPRKKRPAA